MAAPTLIDGISRAIKVFAAPSIGLLVLVVGVKHVYGGQEAGIAYVMLTAALLFGIYSAAKYWNTRYTIGFVIGGLLVWFGVPGVIPQFVPSLFADLGLVVGLLFLVLIALMISDKWG